MSRDSISESESNISIGPSSIDSRGSLGRRSKPRHVIYEGSEIDDSDAHSELDLSLYDADEYQNEERTRYRISLGSDGFESILSDSSAFDEDRKVDEEVMFRNGNGFNSFLNVDSRDSELTPPHQPSFLQLHQQNQQQLQMLQRQQVKQIQEQQQRYPHVYQTPTSSNAAPKIALLETPTDPYDVLETPPGEPPIIQPSQLPSDHLHSSTPFDKIYTPGFLYLPWSMNSWLLSVLMIVGYGIGFGALSAAPPEAYGYWLNLIGMLYIRIVNCIAVPMGICQVIFSVSTLTARGTLLRLWLKTLGYYLIICLLSVAVTILIAGASRSFLKQTDDLSFEVSTARFGFQCSNSKYLQLNGTSLACNSNTFDEANSTAAVFPSFVDVNAVLGLPETIPQLSFTQYFLLLGARYVPNNAVLALGADHYISLMVIASVVGVAVSHSCRGGGVDSNTRSPLLRIFVHLYTALFTVLDWLQSLALIAVLPLTIGSVLVDPSNARLASFAGRWCLVTLLACVIQSLVLCPIVFFWVTRRQPFGWLLKVMPALLYSILLRSPLLPLAIATKCVVRSREVSPAIFGALFPVLSACNCLAQAVSLPIVLMWMVSYTDCGLPLDLTNSLLLFGFMVTASLGDTALPQSCLVYGHIVWRSFCGSKDVPPTPIAISAVMLIIGKMQAFTNTATNLLLVRMAASTDEGRLYTYESSL